MRSVREPSITHVQPELGASPTAGIGVIAPFDFALDRELWRWMPAGASIYVTRTPPSELAIGMDFAREAAGDEEALTQAARSLSAAEPGAVVYACTSASYANGLAGERRLRAAIERGGARRALTTSGALLDALAALGVSRVGVATPYDAALTAALQDFLAEAGHEPVAVSYLGLTGAIAKVRPESVAELVRRAADAEAEAIVVSCTNLPTIDVLSALEDELDRPVLSANLATAWAALRAAGIRADERPERLFRAATSEVHPERT
ncbi:MAG: maleate cis-trans isomerase family protein [Solirubrobacteraceae bacterium]